MDDPVRPATGGSFVMTKSGALEQIEGPGIGYPAPAEEVPDPGAEVLPVLGGSYVERPDGRLEAVEGPALDAAILAAEDAMKDSAGADEAAFAFAAAAAVEAAPPDASPDPDMAKMAKTAASKGSDPVADETNPQPEERKE
jgi:hypothetical protein